MFTIAFHGGPRDGEHESYDSQPLEVTVVLEDGQVGRYVSSGGAHEVNRGGWIHPYNFEPRTP